MFQNFPRTFTEALDWGWGDFEPYAEDLLSRPLTATSLLQWLADETRLLGLIHELNGRLSVAVDQDNSDQAARKRLDRFRGQVWNQAQRLTNRLERKLVNSGLAPPGYGIQLQRIRTSLAIYQPDNVDLEAEERSFRTQYEKIFGSLQLEVGGARHSVYDILRMLHVEPDRARREQVYRQILSARTAVQPDYDFVWKKLFALRRSIAHNAGLPDYRAYAWQKLNRHDYTPQDVITFCNAIEQVIVPLVADLRRQQAAALGIEVLKPWDLTMELEGGPTGPPYRDTADWLAKSRRVFEHISPVFADHFDAMRAEGLLDLESRPGKSPWNYAERLLASSRTFVFINGRGGQADLFMLFHEFGHAVQMIEMQALPYIRQRMLPDEIGEVASTAMELLGSGQLDVFYPPEQARMVRRNHLAGMLSRWPFAAMVALFQHWAYTHPGAGSDPQACDRCWLDLCERFIPGVDYAGFEDDLRMGWREVLQIYVFPFYFIEYAFAQLGALQIWEHIMREPPQAVERFRQALALGHTVSVPEFYARAGARFALDASTLEKASEVLGKALAE